jgi:Uma2 family endonuclease
MGSPARKRATYDDLLAAPEHMIAELIGGRLVLQPRPALPHSAAASSLQEELGPPFKRARGGPGGWILLFEPELHLGDDVLVPDLAGWRKERLPALEPTAYATLPPDWVCEILSPGTAKVDRIDKLPIYARERVPHTWLVDPRLKTLEVLRFENGRWSIMATHTDDAKVRAEPFDAIELELGLLWADVAWGPEQD